MRATAMGAHEGGQGGAYAPLDLNFFNLECFYDWQLDNFLFQIYAIILYYIRFDRFGESYESSYRSGIETGWMGRDRK